jgi:hypothetical protein
MTGVALVRAAVGSSFRGVIGTTAMAMVVGVRGVVVVW